jgi:tetratricopeptide (TPR) repeat protein
MNGFFLILILLVVLILGGLMLTLTASSPVDTDDETRASLEETDEAEEIISLAKEYESNHQWEQAQEAWSRLIDEEPDRTDALFRRGLIYYRQKNFEEAVGDFEHVQAVSEDPPPQLHLYTARSHRQLSNLERAFNAYQEFQNRTEPDVEVIREMADLARELERWSQARQLYKELKDNAPQDSARHAQLALAEMALDRDLLDRLRENLAALEDDYEQDNLTEKQELHFWYLKAQFHERQDETEKTERFYRKIYQRDPNFRNVQEIMEKELLDLDSESLVRKLQRMDQEAFVDFCRRIVEGMNYKVVETDWSNPEELDIVAREKAMSLQVTRVLFEFKKWQEQAGKLAIKEFEFRIVEDRYDRGYFVNPGGYKGGAQRYAEGHDKINLMGPSEVIGYLQDWYREGG